MVSPVLGSAGGGGEGHPCTAGRDPVQMQVAEMLGHSCGPVTAVGWVARALVVLAVVGRVIRVQACTLGAQLGVRVQRGSGPLPAHRPALTCSPQPPLPAETMQTPATVGHPPPALTTEPRPLPQTIVGQGAAWRVTCLDRLVDVCGGSNSHGYRVPL